MRSLSELLGRLNDALDKRLGGMFDVELPEPLDDDVTFGWPHDDGPDYQCGCGRWLPCRHCHPEA